MTEGECAFDELSGSPPMSIRQQAMRGLAKIALERGDRDLAKSQYERILGKVRLYVDDIMIPFVIMCMDVIFPHHKGAQSVFYALPNPSLNAHSGQNPASVHFRASIRCVVASNKSGVCIAQC